MSGEDLKFAFVAFTAIFFVVDPFVAVPFFMTITADDSPEKRRAMALRAAVAACVTLVLFAVAGGLIFKAFGVSLGAFKIAGGLMLFLMALDMMRAQPSRTRSTAEEQEEGVARDDVAIVPMAIPMLAGPGSIATVMVLMSRAAWQPVATTAVFLAVVVTCLIAWLLLRSAAAAERFLSKTTLHVAQRVMGLLLAAVAVEFVVGGIRDLWPTFGA
ncbi:MAG: MarC family protein [Deltaproteobacteria bacterium]|nr:MarC family protein [Deltaproteobacteria bacterium]